MSYGTSERVADGRSFEEESLLASAQYAAQREFWFNRIAEHNPTYLGVASTNDAGTPGGRVHVDLPAQHATHSTTSATDRADEDPFVVRLAALCALLYRYLDQDSIHVLVPVSDVHPLNDAVNVGVQLSGSMRFDALCVDVASSLTMALANADYPRRELMRQLPMLSINGNCFLTDVACYPEESGGKRLEPGEELIHFVFDSREPQRLEIEYGGQWTSADIDRLAVSYVRLFTYADLHRDTTLDELPLLTPAEIHQQLITFNSTDVPSVDDVTIHECFERQVARTPHHVAAIDQEVTLTFAELNNRAHCVAAQLLAHGIRPGSVVAIVLQRSCELLVSVLGVLKAGGAFLMVDPELPPNRIDYLLCEAGAEVGISLTELLTPPVRHVCRWLTLDALSDDEPTAQMVDISPDDAAYVIFTSGSTGASKAVQVSHRSFVNRMRWLQRNYRLTTADVSLQRSALSFDPAICEMLRLLPVGGRVCIMPHGTESNIEAVIDAIDRYQVTVIDLVPSPLTAVLEIACAGGLLDKLRSLRWVFAGAETMPPSLVSQFNDTLFARFQTHLINTWGATETTVDATWYDCSTNASSNPVPIGQPIDNTRVFVLSRAGNLLPLGLSGELCIAGSCLSDGYHGAPELTGSRFVAAPQINVSRLYRSGDIARFRSDGNLEFLGRLDLQLKIRGVRIDPMEIEMILREHTAVRDAVVRAERSGSDVGEQLVAYVVAPDRDNRPTPAQLRDLLAAQLPNAFVPDRVFVLEAFPRTRHDKIDREALAAAGLRSSSVLSAPQIDDAVEAQLLAIIEELLERGNVSIDDDFFDVGGQSLAAIRLVARIHARLGVKLSLSEIFEQRTLRAIASCIRGTQRKKAFETIPPIKDQTFYETSHAQRRFWALSQSGSGLQAYNVPFSMLVSTALDREALQQALDRLIARHEILRTTFKMVDGVLVQVVQPAMPRSVVLSFVDNVTGGEDTAYKLLAEERNRRFDLERGPLVRSGIIHISESRELFFVTIHHVIVDAWSLGLMLRELFTVYNRLVAGADAALPAMAFQYRDYATWHNSQLRRDDTLQLKRFWSRYLRDAPILDLTSDFPRTDVGRSRASRRIFTIPEQLAASSVAVSNANDASLFMFLLAAVATVLSQRSGQADLVIGTPVSGRLHVALEEQLGCFVNPLALRVHIAPNMSFVDLLRGVRRDCLTAFDAQDYPFDLVVSDRGVRRDLSSSPLFDVMLVLQNVPDLNVETLVHGAVAEAIEVGQSPAKLDLIITFEEVGGALHGIIDYNADLFAEATIDQIAEEIWTLVQRVTLQPEAPLFVDARAPSKLLPARCPSAESSEVEVRCLHRFFELQVERTPLRIATICKHRHTTYRDLNESANRLAHCLRENYAVGPEAIVAVLMERSDRSVEMELAILKAGAAFLPIDQSYPSDRIRLILEDSGPSAILVEDRAMLASVSHVEIPVICLAEIDPEQWPRSNPSLVNSPADPAYVVYTSGSTGRPKGVVVEHSNICSLLCLDDWLFDFDGNDTWTAFHSVSFDFSIWEMYVPLSRGAKVVFVPKTTAADPSLFAALLIDEGVTVLSQVPSAFDSLSSALLALDPAQKISLRWVVFGGEPIKLKPIIALRERFPAIRFVNGYGISETTILSTFKEIDLDAVQSTQNIGTAIGNQRIQLLDARLVPVPDGAEGEICVEGPAVARGYLNRPDLTDAHFITGSDGVRMYRSGDFARRSKNGDLIFLGRHDTQVKIRGFRVELDEVRHVLLGLDEISEAVVLAIDDNAGLTQLVAYVRACSDVDCLELRQRASRLLPGYMVPTRIVLVDHIPLDANGKIDRRRLSTLGDAAPSAPYEAMTETERQLLAVFEEVIGVRGVRVTDDFFRVGGHSLSAVHLVSRIAEVCSTTLSIDDIFNTPTVRELAGLVDLKLTSGVCPELAPVPPAADYSLSPTQHAFWLLEEFRELGCVVDTPTVYDVEGRIEPDAGAGAMGDLFAAFEILRTTFRLIGDQPRQVVKPHGLGAEAFRWTDLSDEIDVHAVTQRVYDSEAFRPFDLEQGPLFRLHVVRIAERHHILICGLSHIISDGSTLSLLMQMWRECHDARLAGQPIALEPPKIQFRDFSEWQRKYLVSTRGEADLAWWATTLAGRPQIDLVARWPGSQLAAVRRPSFYARWREVVLDKTLTVGLEELCRNASATLFMGLNSLVRAFIHIYTGLSDISIGSPFEHRFEPDIHRQPGPFVNVLPLRTCIQPSENLLDVLGSVRAAAVAAYARSLVPTELIAERLEIARPASLIDLGLTLQTQWTDGDRNLTKTSLVAPERVFGLDLPLWFDACETDAGIAINLAYDDTRFSEHMIDEACNVFVSLAAQLISRPSAKLHEFVAVGTSPYHEHVLSIDLDL